MNGDGGHAADGFGAGVSAGAVAQDIQPHARTAAVRRPETEPEVIRFIMCAPVYLSTRVKNNVWMEGGKVNVERALSQWKRSVNVIRAFGVDVIEIEPQKACQDQTYTANVAVALEPFIVLANYKAPGRDCEIEPARALFEGLGYNTVQPPFYFEGEADLKRWKPGVYFGGVGQFSDARSYRWMEENFGVQIIDLEEVNKKLYHLDCSLFVVDEENFIVTRQGLSNESFKTLEKLANITVTPPEISITGATNAVKVPGKPIVLSGTFNPEWPEYRASMEWMNKTFDGFGWTVVLLDVDEYDKSGADLSCTVMHLDFLPHGGG